MKNISAQRLREIIAQTIREIESAPFVPVFVSGRHVHLSKRDANALFGEGYSLTPERELLPGQFACKETLTVIGRRGSLERVRILSPARRETQLEVSITDGYVLGAAPPVNESGNLAGAASVVLENPLNSRRVEAACAIAAKRHIHVTPSFAERHALADGQIVSVEMSGPRAVVFAQTLVRVSACFKVEMHLDTDEANSAMIKSGDLGRILTAAPSVLQEGPRDVFTGGVLSRADVALRAAGSEISVGPSCVITALAREAAAAMNVKIIKRES